MRGSCATNYWFVRPRITVLYARLFSPTNFWFVSEVVVCHQLRVVQFYLLLPPLRATPGTSPVLSARGWGIV